MCVGKILTMKGREERVRTLLAALRDTAAFSELEAVETIYIGSPGVDTPEQSCAAGHVNILSSFLEGDRKSIVVLEDDVSIAGLTKENLSSIVSYVESASKPMVFILGGQEGIRSSFYFVGRRTYEFDFDCWEEFFSKKYLFRTCCYVMNRSAASLYCSRNSLFRFRADDWSTLLPDGRFFLVEQSLLTHPKELRDSTIQGTRTTDIRRVFFIRFGLVVTRLLLCFVKRLAVKFL